MSEIEIVVFAVISWLFAIIVPTVLQKRSADKRSRKAWKAKKTHICVKKYAGYTIGEKVRFNCVTSNGLGSSFVWVYREWGSDSMSLDSFKECFKKVRSKS